MSVSSPKSGGWAWLLGSLSCAGAMAVMPATHALAAEAAQATETAGLQEVTVTAQRREENSQRVPIAINTIAGDDVLARGTTTIASLAAVVPNLAVTSGSNTHIYIRGV